MRAIIEPTAVPWVLKGVSFDFGDFSQVPAKARPITGDSAAMEGRGVFVSPTKESCREQGTLRDSDFSGCGGWLQEQQVQQHSDE
jgi:hypothetical protein